MLTMKETLDKIHELEKAIEQAKTQAEGSIDQMQFVEHCERLREHYIKEHRKAAKRENDYAMR